MIKYVYQFGVISEASPLNEGLETFDFPQHLSKTQAEPEIAINTLVPGPEAWIQPILNAPSQAVARTNKKTYKERTPNAKQTIALCIAGHVRNWDQYKQSLAAFIARHRANNMEIHVYFSCWGDTLGAKILSPGPAHHMLGIERNKPFTAENLCEMVGTLKPCGFSVQSQTLGQFDKKGSALIPFCDHYAHRPIANVSQLFIREKALSLLDDIPTNYDLYVLTRFDLLYGPDFLLDPQSVNKNEIHTITNNQHNGVSDLFLFSKTLAPLRQYTKMDLLKITKMNGNCYNAHQMLQFAFNKVFERKIVTHDYPIGIEGR